MEGQMESEPESEPNLASCPDCLAGISPYAEVCPHCGRPFQRQPTEVVPGPRWSWTVYWGIVLFVVIPCLISAALTVILFMVLFGAAAVMSTGPR